MILFRFVAFYFALLLLVSCGERHAVSGTQPTPVVESDSLTEILYFHGKKRCVSCTAIEWLTREVVDSLNDEHLVLKVIDSSEPESQKMVDQYEVSWSKLILVRGGQVVDLTASGFRYAKDQPHLFKVKLVEALNRINSTHGVVAAPAR